MTTFADQVFQFGGVPVTAQELMLAGGNWYWVDPAYGTAGGTGLGPHDALASLEDAYDRCRDGYHDGVILIGNSYFDLTEALVWSKSRCHLIGAGNPGAQCGARAKIEGTAAKDIAAPMITLSGSGCLWSGVKIFDGKDADTDSGALLISGDNNRLYKCQVSGMGHATPAARAGSYSLKVTGGEVELDGCYVGLDTIARTAASSELIVAGERFRAVDTKFATYAAAAAANFLVSVDNSAKDLRDITFDGECVFYSYVPNWAAGTTNAFHVPTGGNTFIVHLGPLCSLSGVSVTWADNPSTGHIYGTGPAANAGFGLATAPTS